jgi:hypothetical protein
MDILFAIASVLVTIGVFMFAIFVFTDKWRK